MIAPCEWQLIFGTRIKIRLHAKMTSGVLAILLAGISSKLSSKFPFLTPEILDGEGFPPLHLQKITGSFTGNLAHFICKYLIIKY